jgi:putative drug exporter of the RND superfamily
VIRKVANFLSGRRTRWIVVIFWLAVAGGLAPLAGKMNDVQKNDVSAWLPKNAEATKVLEQAAKFQPSDTMPAVVIYDRPSGITPADVTKAKADGDIFKTVKDVLPQVQGPFPSKDGKALQTVVSIHLGKEGWAGATKAVDKMIDAAKKNAGGLDVHVTGQGGYAADSGKIFSGGDFLMLATFGVVILVLLIAYRSPVLVWRPILAAVVSLVVSQGVVYLLAKYAGLTVNAQSGFILTVLVFGAATDYALLLIARYREELRRHESQYEAMGEAWYRSSEAIVASAATVAVSMLVLLFAELNSTKGLGPVCAVGIGVSLLVMMTLLPARLVRGPWLWSLWKGTHGRWVFWPMMPRNGSAEPTVGGFWSRVGRTISGRPRLVWVGTALVLGVMAIGITSLKADGLPNKDGFTKKTQAVIGEEIQAKHFPAGSGQPIFAVAKASAAEQVRGVLSGVPGIAEVAPPVVKDGEAFILGTLKDGADSQAALDTVRKARTAIHKIEGADAQLGGGAAIKLDMEDAAARDSKVIIPIVLVVVFLILALLLRAIVAPLLLMATVVLSFGATLGVSSLIFKHVFHFAGADASFPLMTFVFLVALGIDYNIFLVTRIREEALEHGTRRGALIGLSATGGVITSAGLVLAGTFAALGAMPLVFAAELGFAVAFGVLMDTLIVRSVLVTALTLDVGRWMWWPSKLFKRHDDAQPPAGEDELQPVLAGR